MVRWPPSQKANYKNQPTDHPKFRWRSWGVLLCIIITAVVVRFVDNLHFNNLIAQANNQAAVSQTQSTQQRYDIKFLIDNAGSLNCYDLHSDYARGVCNGHDASHQ